MTAPCVVSGPLVDSTGTLRPSTKVVIRSARVRGQYGKLVAPFEIEATTDGAGVLTVSLLPGPYLCLIAVAGGAVSFDLNVPEALTAPLAECVSGPDTIISPQALIDTLAARDAAIAARWVFVQETRPPGPGPWIWWQTDASGQIVDLTVADGVP